MTKILWNLVYGNTVLSVPTASIDSGPRRWLAIGSQLVQARMRISFCPVKISRENILAVARLS